jgi:serine/threonine protein kinase
MLPFHSLGSSPEKRADALRALRNELGLLSRLRHPCILQIYGWTQPDSCDSFGIVMERAYGDLYKLLGELREAPVGQSGQRGAFVPSGLSVAAFTSIVSGVASAIEAMHAARVVNRDIKSPNILLRAGYTVRQLWDCLERSQGDHWQVGAWDCLERSHPQAGVVGGPG